MPAFWKETIGHGLDLLRNQLHGERTRLNLLVAAGLIGMVLLCLSEWIATPSKAEASLAQDQAAEQEDWAGYAAELEQRLKRLIETVEGAGECNVMVTLAASEQTVYATDTEQGETTSRSEHVLLGEEALIESITCPAIQGVAIVCEGGDDIHIQNTVTELVRALTGIGANHITVTKMVTAQ